MATSFLLLCLRTYSWGSIILLYRDMYLLEFGLRLDLRKKDLLVPHDALPAHVGTAGRHQLLLEEML